MNDRLEIFFEAMENECYDKSDSNSGEKQSKEQQDEFADGRGFKFENGNEIMEHVRGMLIDKEPDWISTDNEYETATL